MARAIGTLANQFYCAIRRANRGRGRTRLSVHAGRQREWRQLAAPGRRPTGSRFRVSCRRWRGSQAGATCGLPLVGFFTPYLEAPRHYSPFWLARTGKRRCTTPIPAIRASAAGWPQPSWPLPSLHPAVTPRFARPSSERRRSRCRGYRTVLSITVCAVRDGCGATVSSA